MTHPPHPPTVAIIGAGFAGVAVAAQLLRAVNGPAALDLVLIERAPEAGRGVAYATPSPLHLLNVPAGRMSLWPDDDAHFTAWLAARGEEASPMRFVPRGLYGTYVTEVLTDALAHATPGRTLRRVTDEAIGLLPDAGRYRIRLGSGDRLEADKVVLALGNMPPAPPGRLGNGVLEKAWYVVDPWTPPALAPLAPGSEVLLVGTGLSALDLAMSLLDEGGAARVTLVSRRAMLPQPWAFVPAYPDWLNPETAPLRVSKLLRLVREAVREAEAAGHDWRAVMDALRPHTQRLWQRLPLVERRRFLRHARSFWESHRHRVPPAATARLQALRAEGRLVILAARVASLEDAPGGGAEATIVPRGGTPTTLHVARVVNCTGPELNYRKIRHTLALDLVGTGLARPSPLLLGLDVDDAGRLRDEDGLPTPGIWAVGSLRKGALWETTAVPELRFQAAEVAQAILIELPDQPLVS